MEFKVNMDTETEAELNKIIGENKKKEKTEIPENYEGIVTLMSLFISVLPPDILISMICAMIKYFGKRAGMPPEMVIEKITKMIGEE